MLLTKMTKEKATWTVRALEGFYAQLDCKRTFPGKTETRILYYKTYKVAWTALCSVVQHLENV